MVAGLRRASLTTLCISCLAFGEEVLLSFFRLSDESIGTSAGRLSVTFVVGGALYLYARGGEVRAPYLWCCALLQLVCVVDGLSAAASGGFSSPFAHAIFALLMVWPLLVPGGLRYSVLPLIGGLACYECGFCFASREPQWLARALTLGVFQLAAVGAALFVAEELERSWRRIAGAARVDSLTGLMSRRYFFERLEVAWRLRIRRGIPMSLVILDIDHFKAINDGHGHPAGDEILRLVSAAVSAVIRNTDFAGRLGGDEIVLALIDCEGPQAIEVVDRLRRRVADTPLLFRGSTIRATLSAGVAAVASADLRDVAEMIREADAALYRSKEGGRNRASLAPILIAG